MSSINVTLRNGETTVVQAHEDLTLMELIRDAGIDDISALCGGCCSCATCHIYITGGPVALLPAAEPTEREILESIDTATPQSRLACQCTYTDGMSGLSVTIAPEA